MPNNCVTATLLLCFLRSLRWAHSLYTAESRVHKQRLPKTPLPLHGLPSSERVRKAGSLIAMFHFIKPVKVLHQTLCPSGGNGFFFSSNIQDCDTVYRFLLGRAIYNFQNLMDQVKAQKIKENFQKISECGMVQLDHLSFRGLGQTHQWNIHLSSGHSIDNSNYPFICSSPLFSRALFDFKPLLFRNVTQHHQFLFIDGNKTQLLFIEGQGGRQMTLSMIAQNWWQSFSWYPHMCEQGPVSQDRKCGITSLSTSVILIKIMSLSKLQLSHMPKQGWKKKKAKDSFPPFWFLWFDSG